jgi:hypothetical protein
MRRSGFLSLISTESGQIPSLDEAGKVMIEKDTNSLTGRHFGVLLKLRSDESPRSWLSQICPFSSQFLVVNTFMALVRRTFHLNVTAR